MAKLKAIADNVAEKIIFVLDLTLFQTTNFRFFQTERVCRWQFQVWRKWQIVLQTVRKHCGKRKKLLFMSIFSFFYTVFKRLVLQARKNQGLFGKGLTLSKTSNFRLIHTEIVCRQQFQFWWKWWKVLQNSRKHCGKRRNYFISKFKASADKINLV